MSERTERDDIAHTLETLGERYSGNDPWLMADEWLSAGFDCERVSDWTQAECWNPAIALWCRKRGILPLDAACQCEDFDSKRGSAERYRDGAMYAVCNGELEAGKVFRAPRLPCGIITRKGGGYLRGATKAEVIRWMEARAYGRDTIEVPGLGAVVVDLDDDCISIEG